MNKKLIIQIQIMLLLIFVSSIVTKSASAQAQPERVFTLPRNSKIKSYAISDDGTRIAAAFFDKNAHESKIVVMNAATGEQISTFSKHPYSIPSVTFSPDGNLVLSGGIGGIARLWDADTGVEIATVSTYRDLDYFPLGFPSVEAVAFSPDGQNFATMNDLYEPYLQVWDTQTQEKLYSVNGLIGIGLGMEYTPNGKYIVTDVGVIISLEQKKVIKSIFGVGATISKDGEHVYILSDGKKSKYSVIEKWDIKTGGLVSTTPEFLIKGVSGKLTSISKDGRFLLFTSDDEQETGLFDALNENVALIFAGNETNKFRKLKLVSNQNSVIGFAGNRLFTWDISDLTASVPDSVKFE